MSIYDRARQKTAAPQARVRDAWRPTAALLESVGRAIPEPEPLIEPEADPLPLIEGAPVVEAAELRVLVTAPTAPGSTEVMRPAMVVAARDRVMA
jgi:hypothetical protein